MRSGVGCFRGHNENVEEVMITPSFKKIRFYALIASFFGVCFLLGFIKFIIFYLR